MSRFSPTVRPIAAPGFLEGLSGAVDAGVQSYRTTRDRAEAQTDRDRRRAREDDAASRQRDHDFMQGIGAPGAEEYAPVGPPQDDRDPLAEALTAQGGANPGNPTGVPGAFDPATGTFAAPRIKRQVLPSGRGWDPQSVLDREMAAKLQAEEMETLAAERGRAGGVARRTGALGALRQPDTPFEALMPELARAIAETEGGYEGYLREQLRPRVPVRMVERQIDDTRADVGQVRLQVPRESEFRDPYTGTTDRAALAEARAPFLAQLAALQARADSLGGVRDSLVATEQGRPYVRRIERPAPEEAPAPPRGLAPAQAQAMQREMTDLADEVAGILNDPSATAEERAEARALLQEGQSAVARRYQATGSAAPAPAAGDTTLATGRVLRQPGLP